MEFLKIVLIATACGVGSFAAIVCILLIPVRWFEKKMNENDVKYEPKPLLAAFESYLKEVTEDEKYEQIKELRPLIEELKTGKIPALVSLYRIDKKPMLYMSQESDERTRISFDHTYKIRGKLTDKI